MASALAGASLPAAPSRFASSSSNSNNNASRAWSARAAAAGAGPLRRGGRVPTTKVSAIASDAPAGSSLASCSSTSAAAAGAGPGAGAGAAGRCQQPPLLPVETCQHVHLGSAAGVPDALRRIRGGLRGLVHDVSSGAMPPFRSG
jgi:hypothetical protein